MAEGKSLDSLDEKGWESPVEEINGLLEDTDLKTVSQPYKLHFGKHKGLPLDEVPPGYIHWLVWNGIHLRYNDLKAALDERRQVQAARAQGLSPAVLNSNRKRRFSQTEMQSPGHVSNLQGNDHPTEAFTSKSIDESTTSGCMKPSPQDTEDPRFFNRRTQEALWITANDALNFFKVDSHFLNLAKILPLSTGSQKYSLYSVYTCAQQFHTMTHLTPQQALTNFLKKNECQHPISRQE